MKKILYFIIAAAAMLAVSCNKDDNEGAAGLDGKWTAVMNDHHPLDITFEGSSYTWHVGGVHPMKETGTYSYENNILTLKGEKYFTCETEWNEDGYPVESGDWKEVSEPFGPHVYEVKSITREGLVIEVKEDSFYSEMTIYMVPGNGQTLSESELKGTWEGAHDYWNEEGGYGSKFRLSFNGSDYELIRAGFEITSEDGKPVYNPVLDKQSGSWTHKDGVLSLKPTKASYSYQIVNLSPLEYEFAAVNFDTFQSDKWFDVELTNDFLDYDYPLAIIGDELIWVVEMETTVMSKK